MKKQKIYMMLLVICLCTGCAPSSFRPMESMPPDSREVGGNPSGRTIMDKYPDTPKQSMKPETSGVVPHREKPTPPVSYTAETMLGDMQQNRVKNIQKAAKRLSGVIIEPGEEFSFNDCVGARTQEKGYRTAPIIIQGEKQKGVGGGICQVSSTLYNAALKAGLEISERHEHTGDVDYVEEGRDATVCYDSLDLKFVNNKDRKIVIACVVSEGRLKVTLTEGD